MLLFSKNVFASVDIIYNKIIIFNINDVEFAAKMPKLSQFSSCTKWNYYFLFYKLLEHATWLSNLKRNNTNWKKNENYKSLALTNLNVGDMHYSKKESLSVCDKTWSDQNRPKPNRKPPGTNQEPTRIQPESCNLGGFLEDPNWFLVGSRWVMIGFWWVLDTTYFYSERELPLIFNWRLDSKGSRTGL